MDRFRSISVRVVASLAPVLLTAACSGDAAVTPTAPSVPTFQISGSVRDAAASIPIPGVSLTAVDGANAGQTAQTGADGKYTLTNLTAGTFTLRARHSGYEDLVQEVTITSYTTIDMRLTPTRGLSSGWSGGSLYATVDGQRNGWRLVTAEMTQSGTTVTGTFTTPDATSGSFTGQVNAGQFNGTIRLQMLMGGQTCRGTASNVTGPVTPHTVELSGLALRLENCGNSVTDVAVTFVP